MLNDSALVELQDYHACEGGISLGEYGYASDSDLDEEEEEEEEEGKNDEMVKDNEKCVNDSAEQISQTASVQNLNFTTRGVQCIIPSRRVLVTDTAFNTWQALLYYLYTDEIVFAPLRSQGNRTTRCCSLEGPPPCLPKSMYRLACKINHETLQVKALAAIRSSLTEHNILHECSSSLKSRFPSILEVETESLLRLITTPPVMREFLTIAGADP